MKKLLKPEIEFIAFNTDDVITTSGEYDTVTFVDKSETDTSTEQNAHTDPNYSAGGNSLWNLPQ